VSDQAASISADSFVSKYATGRRLAALTTIQVVGYGLLYYAGLVALPRISAETGWSFFSVSAALSGSMVVSAATAIPIGRYLDKTGPRTTMIVGTFVGAAGLVVVGIAMHLAVLFLGFMMLGLAMASTLYGVAFTTITHRYQGNRNRPLVILTIAAGFASTIFAPVMAWLIEQSGWRAAFVLIAAAYLVTCVPLVLASMERRWDLPAQHRRDQSWLAIRKIVLTGRFGRLMFATLAIAVGLYTATVNAVPLFEERGYTYEAAAWGLGIIGAGQVLGRFLFYVVPGRRIPWVQLVTTGAVSSLLLFFLGAVAAPFLAVAVIAFLAGAGRGAMTLVDATAVSDRWGTANYGAINGILHAPIAVLLGLTPALGVFLADTLGSFAAMAMAMAGIAALGALVGRWT